MADARGLGPRGETLAGSSPVSPTKFDLDRAPIFIMTMDRFLCVFRESQEIHDDLVLEFKDGAMGASQFLYTAPNSLENHMSSKGVFVGEFAHFWEIRKQFLKIEMAR